MFAQHVQRPGVPLTKQNKELACETRSKGLRRASVIPLLGRLVQEDCTFEANRGSILRFCFADKLFSSVPSVLGLSTPIQVEKWLKLAAG